MMDSSKIPSVRFMETLAATPEDALPSYYASLEGLYNVDAKDCIATKDHLYELFLKWAEQNREKTVPNNVFFRQAKGFVSKEIRPSYEGKRIQAVVLKRPRPEDFGDDGESAPKQSRTKPTLEELGGIDESDSFETRL